MADIYRRYCSDPQTPNNQRLPQSAQPKPPQPDFSKTQNGASRTQKTEHQISPHSHNKAPQNPHQNQQGTAKAASSRPQQSKAQASAAAPSRQHQNPTKAQQTAQQAPSHKPDGQQQQTPPQKTRHNPDHSPQGAAAAAQHHSSEPRSDRQVAGEKCGEVITASSTECHNRGNTDSRSKPDSQLNLQKLLSSLLPRSVYNPSTKKFLGLVTAEDLLLLALIFLFSENEENTDPLLILALVYILISDYIDLPELGI